MKKTILLASVLTILLCFTQCNSDSDDTSKETTVAEDKENIDDVMDDMIVCAENSFAGKMEALIRKFGGFSLGNIINEDWVEEIMEELDDKLAISTISDGDKFLFSSNSGTYTWNNTTKEWSYANNLTNKIVVKMPDQPSNNTNNVIATLNSYSQEQVTFDGDKYWAPESVDFSMTHDGVEVMSVSLDDVDYDHNSKYSIPISLNSTVFLSPISFTMKHSRLTSTSFNFSFIMSNAGCDMNFDGTLNLSSNDYDNLTEDDLKSATGTFSYGALEFRMEVDLESILKLDDPTPTQINKFANADVYQSGAQIGEIEYVEVDDGTGGEEIELHIVYKDGTRDNLEVHYDVVLEAAEDLIRPYLDPSDANWYPF